MWSFSVVVQTHESATEFADGLVDQVAPLDGPADAESREQITKAIEAAKLLLDSGALGGPGTTINVTLSGHANAGHAPLDGWQNDFLSLSFAQVGYAPPGGDVGPGRVTEASTLREPDAASEPTHAAPAFPAPGEQTAAAEHAAANVETTTIAEPAVPQTDEALAAELGVSPAPVVVPPVGQNPEGWPPSTSTPTPAAPEAGSTP